MLKQGLLEEVQKLADMGYTKDMVSMQGLGYKEILSYLDHTCTLEEAVYILKRDTRHLPNGSLPGSNAEKDVIWVNKNEFAYKDKETLDYILKNCEKRKYTMQEMTEMYQQLGISQKVLDFGNKIEEDLKRSVFLPLMKMQNTIS